VLKMIVRVLQDRIRSVGRGAIWRHDFERFYDRRTFLPHAYAGRMDVGGTALLKQEETLAKD
jgi:hypothetical protein